MIKWKNRLLKYRFECLFEQNKPVYVFYTTHPSADSKKIENLRHWAHLNPSDVDLIYCKIQDRWPDKIEPLAEIKKITSWDELVVELNSVAELLNEYEFDYTATSTLTLLLLVFRDSKAELMFQLGQDH